MGKTKEKNVYTEYYDLVGCKVDATPEEIKKAYRKTALRLHPDRGGDEEEFKRMKQAYDVISDPNKRKMYDKYGPQVVRAMDGEIPTSMDFITNLRKRDRFKLVALITFASFIILLFPILFSIRWDANETTSEKIPYSWAVAFIPLWVFEGLFILFFTLETQLPPLDHSDPDVDEEAKSMWRAQKTALTILRLTVLVPLLLLVTFEIFLVLRLDGTVKWDWWFIMLPFIILQAFFVVSRLLTAPEMFIRLDPAFNSPDAEDQRSTLSYCTPAVLGRPSFWLFVLTHVKWSLSFLISGILIAVLADWKEDNQAKSFFLAMIPLFVVIGLALVANCVIAALEQPSPVPEEDRQDEANANEQHPPQEPRSLIGVFVAWCCSYGMLLIMICTGAAKLTNVDSLSAFAVFSPIFFLVGCLCCTSSCVAMTVSAEDLQASQGAAQAAQSEGESGAAAASAEQAQSKNYGAMGEHKTEDVTLTIT